MEANTGVPFLLGRSLVVSDSTLAGLLLFVAFYKSYSIFFKRMGASLQIILYFCALELMPLMVLWGVLFITDNYLIINF